MTPKPQSILQPILQPTLPCPLANCPNHELLIEEQEAHQKTQARLEEATKLLERTIAFLPKETPFEQTLARWAQTK
jgi:hypothetical protein